jgi:hypothetical protein
VDHPRFEPVKGGPDDAHRHYHGGRLVNLVLRLADWWLGRGDRKQCRATLDQTLRENCFF